MTIQKLNIETMLPWSEPKRIDTKNGPRMLRKARPDENFWNAWRENKDTLKAAGLAVSKAPGTEHWEVCLWQHLSEDIVAAENAARAESHATDAQIEIPAPAGLEYLPYQKGGIAYAMSRQNVLIGDEMGLGKTIQAIGIINADPTVKTVLVVCPASLKLNWLREMSKWLVRDHAIVILDSKFQPVANSVRGVTGELPINIFIVNYDILGKVVPGFAKFFMLPEGEEMLFDLIIGDEIHYCKNPKAARTKNMYGIKGRRRVFMTGTPITNRPKELQPIAGALDPETFGNFWKFAKRYCNAQNNGFGWSFDGVSNLEELQDKLRRSIMVRRLKSEVLKELPPKRRQIVELDATGLTGLVAKESKRAADLEEKLIVLRAEVELAKASDNEADYKRAVENLREASSAGFDELSKLRHETALAKVPKVIEHVNGIIEDQENYKVVVFAHHKDVVKALLENFGPVAVAIVGDTPMADRQRAVDRFQTDPSIKVFVGSIQAAGVGITLTASAHVIFAELDWVPANMSQAEDRCHRIGQVNSVLIQHLVLDGSLDVKLAKTLIAKQIVIDRALDDKIEDTDAGEIVTEVELAPVKATPKPEPIIIESTAATTREISRADIDKAIAEKTFSQSEIDKIHAKLKYLAGVCDGANSWDGSGFNKFDTHIGKSLAEAPYLSQRQAFLGSKLVHKYRRQLEGVESTAAAPDEDLQEGRDYLNVPIKNGLLNVDAMFPDVARRMAKLRRSK